MVGQWWVNCQGKTVFSPNQIPGLILWLDANNPAGDGTQPADGTGVTDWVDLSNNHYLASQATGAFQPTFQTNIQNGLPCFLFTALNNQGYTISSFVAPAQTTVFVVLKQLNSGTSGVFLLEQSGDAGLNPGFFLFGQSIPALVSNGGSNIQTAASGNWIGTTFNYIASKYNGTTLSSYLNTSVIATAAGSLTNANVTDYLNIGYRDRGASLWYNGYVGEIIIYNNSLSPTNLSLIQSYISSKWGI